MTVKELITELEAVYDNELSVVSEVDEGCGVWSVNVVMIDGEPRVVLS